MMLDSKGFIKLAKQYVWEMAKESLCPTDDIIFTMDDVYVVTYAYVLGGQKAMLSTTLPDGKYYEVTYNQSKQEIYVDQYVKINQKVYQYIDLHEKKAVMASEYGKSCKAPYQEFVDSIDEEDTIAAMRNIEEGFNLD